MTQWCHSRPHDQCLNSKQNITHTDRLRDRLAPIYLVGLTTTDTRGAPEDTVFTRRSCLPRSAWPRGECVRLARRVVFPRASAATRTAFRARGQRAAHCSLVEHGTARYLLKVCLLQTFHKNFKTKRDPFSAVSMPMFGSY